MKSQECPAQSNLPPSAPAQILSILSILSKNTHGGWLDLTQRYGGKEEGVAWAGNMRDVVGSMQDGEGHSAGLSG